ncbi:MAG: hypothetical protein JWM33_3633, partial [Caulobacteraceae bacterium]|nr:hypothetical protein [Caulobacteraceae bacterium]
LNHLGILGGTLAAFAATDGSLTKIFGENRSLVQWDAKPKVFDDDDAKRGGIAGRPSYAIEDFTSDYDDDDGDDGWGFDNDDDDDPF